VIRPATSRVLTGTVAHLESAHRLACAAAGSELMSPWANTAMSIHLASAALSVHLQACVPAAEHRDCLTALLAARACLTALPADHGLPLLDVALVRNRLASALADAASRPAHRCRHHAPHSRPHRPHDHP
jgi:hypothetical protein